MVIGNIGNLITFEVTDKKVQTFESFTQTVKGRWATHNIVLNKPVPEFLGADLRTLSIPITLRAAKGINPRKITEKIERAIENGRVYTVIIGGKKIGNNKWVITSMSEQWKHIMLDGKVPAISNTLELQEYR